MKTRLRSLVGVLVFVSAAVHLALREHDGDGSTASTLADHLRGDAYALVSKTAEAGVAAVFVALLVLDR